MANEVIIEEYEGTGLSTTSSGAGVPVPAKLLTTQVLDIAEASAQFNVKTVFIRV